MRVFAVFVGVIVSLGSVRTAAAQSLGTFAWRLDPYCNVVRFAISADGPAFRLTGVDDSCGAMPVPAAGVVTPNPDGTYTLVFYLVTPEGHGHYTTATISPSTLGGPWRDDGGLSGTLAFGPAGSGGGSPRPAVQLQRRVTGVCTGSQFVQSVRENGAVDCGSVTGTGGGDITGVAAGTGLAGGGSAGDVTLGIAPGGVGSVQIANASITAADVDASQVQRRVANSCAAGLFFTSIAVDGSAVCADGSGGTSNVALGASALASVTVGDQNTAVGNLALGSATNGNNNTAVGARTLESTTSGTANVAIGSRALRLNSTGGVNVAVGRSALEANVTGGHNVAIGNSALARNLSGDTNVAIGADALGDLTTGDGNIAIGYIAGGDITTGSNNIHIGYQGALNESDTLRIGLQQTRAFIRGIRGVTTAGAAVAVLIDGAGPLGTISSSRRTKEGIEGMGDASTDLMRLRPVTFRYIEPYADGSKPRDYGLIAEEVDEVYPDLVVRNPAGEVETVQYHKLVPMLLNELQRQQRELNRLHGRLVELERRRR